MSSFPPGSSTSPAQQDRHLPNALPVTRRAKRGRVQRLVGPHLHDELSLNSGCARSVRVAIAMLTTSSMVF
jgi:hypothetical protein